MDHIKCDEFRKNPNKNPLTGRTIKRDPNTYKKFDRECNEIESKTREKIDIKKKEFMKRYKEGKKVTTFFDLFPYKKKYETSFFMGGDIISISLYLIYLSKKYDTCIHMDEYNSYMLEYELDKKILHFLISPKKCLIYPISIGLMFINSNINKKFHANAIIFNSISKTIERFEPHGYEVKFYDTFEIDEELEKFANEHGFKYKNINEDCPAKLQTKQLQTKQEIGLIKGTCAIWSLWYLEYRVKFPHFTKSQIHDDFMLLYNQEPDILNRFILYLSQTILEEKIKFYNYLLDKHNMRNTNIEILKDMYEDLNNENKDKYIKWIKIIENENVGQIRRLIKFYKT